LELEFVKDNVGFIRDAVNIGVIRNNQEVILVDSGLDKNTARDIRKTVEKSGLNIKVIINTHSHADHFGGNDYLARNLDVKVYAPEIEEAIIRNPILEPIYLFNGANPISNLRNKFVLAKPSPVHQVIRSGKLIANKVELEVISLPGHSFNQMGILYEGVLFCADSIFSEYVIEKYKIPVLHDVGSQIKTLNMLKNNHYDFFIPSHTIPTDDISQLIQTNRRIIDRTIEDIKDFLEEPHSTEKVIINLCNNYELELNNIQQYYLIRMTVMAYLGYLKEMKKIEIIFENNELEWKLSN
jgi:glyoxylase-like metal-dependent hydrolase (beta-lactamase superfamily II)